MLDDVQCTSTESRLIDCPANFNHNCGHSEDAGVRCTSSTTGKLYLVLIRSTCAPVLIHLIYYGATFDVVHGQVVQLET